MFTIVAQFVENPLVIFVVTIDDAAVQLTNLVRQCDGGEFNIPPAGAHYMQLGDFLPVTYSLNQSEISNSL